MHQILQVYPTSNRIIYLYFSDGRVKKFDAAHLHERGGVFAPLADIDIFLNTCTVMNNTLAWDFTGKRDPYTVVDLDAENLYNTCETVQDPLSGVA
ncbi:MAG: DUF2442 domain-containing protein [Spirochaetes bacterium]|nr:DUF2442 domain-containing protein [Spirochaetota bacterium]